MTNNTFKKAISTTLAVATIATTAIVTSSTAQAGSRDFWRGAAVGAVTGVIVGSAARRHREREVVYVERRPRTRTVVVEREVSGHAWSDEQHIRWCKRKYRSYSVRSDTYQPHYGGRRYCNSPYN